MRRRCFLGASSTFLAAGLSGCTGIVPGLGGDSGGDSGAIKGSSPQGRGYVINLDSSVDIAKVNLINPDGEKVVSQTISDSQTQVKFILAKTGNTDLGRGVTSAYRVGDYTVQVVGGGGNTKELPVTFSPELSVSNVGFLANLEDPPSLNNTLAMNGAFMFKFNNTGNAPAIVDDCSILGPRVPNPLPLTQDRNYDKDGVPYGAAMYRLSERSTIPRQSIAIPAGKTTWYRTGVYPAAIPISGIPPVGSRNPEDDSSSDEYQRPQYTNTSAVRSDYVKPPVQATGTFVAGTGDVSADYTFSLNGSINSATVNDTDFFYFEDSEVTQINGSRRGLS